MLSVFWNLKYYPSLHNTEKCAVLLICPFFILVLYVLLLICLTPPCYYVCSIPKNSNHNL